MPLLSQISKVPIYSSPIIEQITLNQRLAISDSVKNTCLLISQEESPRPMADKSAEAISRHLTALNHVAINSFRELSNVPYALLRGAIHIGDLPETPADDVSPPTETWRSHAAAMLGYLKLFGADAASFKDEMDGRLFHMVMPANNNKRSLLRSTKALNFHTEVVNGYFHEDKPLLGSSIAPDVFALACLRNSQSVRTTILPLSKILNKIDIATIKQLLRPEYKASSQSSFDKNIQIGKVSVLVELTSGHLGIRYSNSKLVGCTPTATAALGILREVISSFDESHSVVLEPGDLLVLNNRLCLHGRGEVGTTSTFNGADRWLLRLYGYTEKTLAQVVFKKGSSHIMVVDTATDSSAQLSAA